MLVVVDWLLLGVCINWLVLRVCIIWLMLRVCINWLLLRICIKTAYWCLGVCVVCLMPLRLLVMAVLGMVVSIMWDGMGDKRSASVWVSVVVVVGWLRRCLVVVVVDRLRSCLM